MKKLLYILLLLIPFATDAQLLVRDTSGFSSPQRGQITYSPTANYVYYRNSTRWVRVSDFTTVDSAVFATHHYVDSIFATAGAPDSSIYATRHYVDSLIDDISGAFVLYTDTASMLSPYLRKIDTTNKWLPTGTVIPTYSAGYGLSGSFDVDTGKIPNYRIADSIALSHTGSTPTWQQTLTQSSVLTANNVIRDTGYHFGIIGADSLYFTLYGSDVSLRMDTNSKTMVLNAHTASFGDKNGTGHGTLLDIDDANQKITITATNPYFAGINTYSSGTVYGLVRNNISGLVSKIAQFPSALVGSGTGYYLTYNGGSPAFANAPNAAADGSTKGEATFTASDFDASSGLISIDYTNGQAASGSNKGFLTSTDWTTFNSKYSGLPTQTGNSGKYLTTNGTSESWATVPSGTVTSIATTSPITGGTITTTGTIGINNAAADGSTKGAASFTAADFDASSGNISIDYTNGQAASASNKGFVTSADWSKFNGKQDVKISATINLKATGNTTIFTTNSGSGNFIITQVLVEMETLSGAGSAASISVGQTATAYTDIVANTALTALNAATKYQPMTLVAPPSSIPPSTAIVFKVNTAATYATANTGKAIIVGFYLAP